MTIDLGIFLPSMSAPGGRPGDMVATARHAEELGFESAWAVDQLVAGTGSPLLDPTIALAAAAGATTRIRLGVGVLIVPLRPVVWIAKQVASLQHVSGDRLLLGVGVGGDRHDQSWDAVGVPRRERGRRTDDALRALPDLLAGKPTVLEDTPGRPTVRLAPAATLPPIVVGGTSDAAVRRTVEHGDSWLLFPGPASGVRDARARLAEEAERRGRATPAVDASLMIAMAGDPAVPDRDGLVRALTDPDGMYGIPADAIDDMVSTGGPDEVAEQLAALGTAGAQRVVISVAAGDWHRQAELVAEARSLVS